jgi:hypothetical protein
MPVILIGDQARRGLLRFKLTYFLKSAVMKSAVIRIIGYNKDLHSEAAARRKSPWPHRGSEGIEESSQPIKLRGGQGLR